MHSLARLFGRSAQVVKEVNIDESAELQVKIGARKAGVVSWILAILGIDSTYTLYVYPDRIESNEGSLSGQIRTVIPLVSLDTYTFGFTKPIQFFFIAAALIVLSLISCFNGAPAGLVFVMLLIASVFVVLYFFMKCLVLSFTTNGANGIFFLFKRSVIEGVNVDETLAEHVASIVKRNYLKQVKSN